MPVAVQQVGNLQGTEVAREGTRRVIAIVAISGYFLMLAAVVIGGWLVGAQNVEDVVKVLTAVAGVLGGVVGAIVGFYFRGEG